MSFRSAECASALQERKFGLAGGIWIEINRP
jgi:hypothetical protein